MLGVVVTEDVAGELEDYVLEPAAGAEQRDIGRAGMPDGLESALRAAVRARGCDEEAVEALEPPRAPGSDLLRGNPFPDRCCAQCGGCVDQGSVGGTVGLVPRVVITDYPHAQHAVEGSPYCNPAQPK